MDMVGILLANGAGRRQKTNEEHTTLLLARQNDQSAVVKMYRTPRTRQAPESLR